MKVDIKSVFFRPPALQSTPNTVTRPLIETYQTTGTSGLLVGYKPARREARAPTSVVAGIPITVVRMFNLSTVALVETKTFHDKAPHRQQRPATHLTQPARLKIMN